MAERNCPTVAVLLALSALGILHATSAWAVAPIVNTVGFEAPDFVLGNLSGQQGWTSSGSSGSLAVVQDDFVFSGDQAVRVDRTAASNRRWADPVAGFPTGRFVTVSWDMAVTVTQAAGVFGPFFGVDTYDDKDNPIAVLGTLGVDATTGEVLIQAEDTGVLIAPGPVVASDEWNHFEIELNFLNKTYRTYLNGDFVASTGFVDGSFGGDDFTDADIAAFAAAADPASQNEPGTAWFDNFLVIDGLIGDYNGDGVVNAADYTVWRDTLGQTGSSLAADGNGDGVVDGLDYDVWRDRFGRGGPAPGALAIGTSPVPEPAGVALMMTAAAGLFVAWRTTVRRRQA